LEVISSGQALAMDGGLGALLRTPTSYFPHDRGIVPYFQPVCTALCMGWPAFSDPWITTALEAIGQRLVAYRVRPWLLGGIDLPTDIPSVATGVAYGTGLDGHNGVPTMAYLGVAALLALLTEQHGRGQAMPSAWPPTLGPVREIAPYLKRRLGESETAPLPELLVPDEFKPLFRDWAQGGIDFSVPEGA